MKKFTMITLSNGVRLALCGLLVVGCGASYGKREKVVKEKHKIEQENSDKWRENYHLQQTLSDIDFTEHAIFVISYQRSQYQEAVSMCKSIGFELPNQTIVDEITSKFKVLGYLYPTKAFDPNDAGEHYFYCVKTI